MAVLLDPAHLAEDHPEASQLTVLLLLLSRSVMFWFFGEGWFTKGTRCAGMGFWRHGSETSSEFVILLRYGMVELQETCMGAECRVQKLQNGSRVFHNIG